MLAGAQVSTIPLTQDSMSIVGKTRVLKRGQGSFRADVFDEAGIGYRDPTLQLGNVSKNGASHHQSLSLRICSHWASCAVGRKGSLVSMDARQIKS